MLLLMLVLLRNALYDTESYRDVHSHVMSMIATVGVTMNCSQELCICVKTA